MKKALLTLLLLLIQIANGESVGKTPLTSQSQEQRSVYQNECENQKKSDSPRSVVGMVVKGVGITVLGLAAIYAVLVAVILIQGPGGC